MKNVLEGWPICSSATGLLYRCAIAAFALGLLLPAGASDVSPPLSVEVDVLPGKAVKLVDPRWERHIPVAILGAESFDPTDVEWSTVQLAGVSGSAQPLRAFTDDVNADGSPDLVLMFAPSELSLGEGETELHLTGLSADGRSIVGSAVVTRLDVDRTPGTGFRQRKAYPLTVRLELTPDDPSNWIDLKGSHAAAVLSDHLFDATTIDPLSLQISGATVIEGSSRQKDVDGDGRLDLVFEFSGAQLHVRPADTVLRLAARTTPGQVVVGSVPFDRPAESPLDGGSFLADPYEPNEDFNEAVPVSCGLFTTNTKIDPLGDVDFYILSGPPGAVVQVDVDAAVLGSELDSLLGTFNQFFVPLVISDDDAAPGEPLGQDSFVQTLIPDNGQLYVAVTSFSDFSFSGDNAFTTGSYQLSISCFANGVDPSEPNDDFASATTAECPSFTSDLASIDPLQDVDFYRLTGPPGSTVSLDVDASLLGSDLDTTLGAFDSAFNLLAASDDDAAPGEPLDTDSFLEVIVPPDGVLYVAVSSFADLVFDGVDGFTTGFYLLTMNCQGAFEPNDDPFTATPLVCPDFGTRTSIDPLGDTDYFRLVGVPGANVAIDVDAATLGSELDSYLATFDSSLVQLDFSDDNPAPGEPLTTDSYLEGVIPQDGVLYIGLASFPGLGDFPPQDLSSGLYELSVSCDADVGCQTIGFGGLAGWTGNTPAPEARKGGAGVIIRDKLYHSHGTIDGAANTDSLSIYDLSADRWAVGAFARVERSDLAAVCVPDAGGSGLVFAVGGNNATTALADVEFYNPNANLWSPGIPMTTARRGAGAVYVPDVGVDGGTRGSVFVIGGGDGTAPESGTPLAANEAYDVETGNWVARAPLPVAMMDIQATAYSANSGEVYVFGGYDGASQSDLVQVYDPVGNNWSGGTPMPTARSNALAGLCGDRIYVIGGSDGVSDLTVNESYDPVGDGWIPGEPLKPTAGQRLAAQAVSSGLEIFALGKDDAGMMGPVNESFACGACLADFDTDDICDANDSCPFAADVGPIAPFGQLISASDKSQFEWPAVASVVQVRGNLSQVQSYAITETNALPLTKSFMDAATPLAGQGFYYLVKPDCVNGSWMSGGAAECGTPDVCPPGERDGNLP